MSIDMAQFHQVFFEESEEGLDALEQGLLSLSEGDDDSEIINTIFRAAHSIKGGSATFGFLAIAEFTHIMETILDEMRNGQRPITPAGVDILLRASDCLREMLQMEQNGTEGNNKNIYSSMEEMENLLEAEVDGNTADSIVLQDSGEDENCGCWVIEFKPFPHFMQTGNDPIRLLNTLSDLGYISLCLHHDNLPAFNALDEELCYLSWTIKLYGKVNKADIEELFEWVDGDCELSIEKITPTAESACECLDNKTAIQVSASVDTQTADTEKECEEAVIDKVAASGEVTVSAGDEVEIQPAESIQTAKKISADNPPVKKQKPVAKKSAGSIRVEIEKIDTLINMMGELVITQSMLSTIGDNFSMDKLESLQQGLAQLERHSRVLQESVMRIRMMPISAVFNRFPRLVHDLSNKLGKKIELIISGENTELDKTVIEQIGDPLVHLVRNSLDHGIEMPQQRVDKGKNETGIIALNAYHHGGNIVIEISDDGTGLDAEKILDKAIEKGMVNETDEVAEEKIYELIMLPGFSTAEKISDVSGRGVGMDVVRKNIETLGGNIGIQSRPAQGSTFTITLPLTLAILDGQSVSVGDENYIVPIVSIAESIQIDPALSGEVKGRGEVFRLRDEYIPVIRLASVFGINNARYQQLDQGLLVVVEDSGKKVGLFVDELNAQQQVVIKSLETNFRRIQGISGATILGDGSVAFILDIPGIVKLSGKNTDILNAAGRTHMESSSIDQVLH